MTTPAHQVLLLLEAYAKETGDAINPDTVSNVREDLSTGRWERTRDELLTSAMRLMDYPDNEHPVWHALKAFGLDVGASLRESDYEALGDSISTEGWSRAELEEAERVGVEAGRAAMSCALEAHESGVWPLPPRLVAFYRRCLG